MSCTTAAITPTFCSNSRCWASCSCTLLASTPSTLASCLCWCLSCSRSRLCTTIRNTVTNVVEVRQLPWYTMLLGIGLPAKMQCNEAMFMEISKQSAAPPAVGSSASNLRCSSSCCSCCCFAGLLVQHGAVQLCSTRCILQQQNTVLLLLCNTRSNYEQLSFRHSRHTLASILSDPTSSQPCCLKNCLALWFPPTAMTCEVQHKEGLNPEDFST